MVRFCDIPRASVMRLQKSDVNSDPLSDTMLAGNPWGLTTCWMKWSARSSGFIVPLQATKCPILVSRSMITHRASFQLLAGNAVMKSIVIASHGLWGRSNGLSSPNGTCRIGLMRRQVSQWSTYWCTYLHYCGQ